MKLQNTKTSHSTNSPGQTHEFAIGNAGVIIEILRNRLYKNPIRTLVQEYISNARDAVREAGKPDHSMTITAPTQANPVFSVRDYGVGITPDRMANVFVRYGDSTKRDDNSQTGGFGIGAKSAWAYADQFNIVTHIDGVKRSYLAHIAGKNNGQLEFVSEDATTEENGTEILIPVRTSDLEEFHFAIQRCVMFWDERPTLIDLKEENWFQMKPILNAEGIIAMPPEFGSSNTRWRVWDHSVRYLVVDGIPYDADSLGVRDLGIEDTFVAIRCNTGEVEISANREGLSVTADNSKVVADMVKKANEAISRIKVKDAADTKDLKSYLHSLAFWYKYTGSVEGIKPKYGLTLDDNAYVTHNGKTLCGYRWTINKNKVSSRENTYITISQLAEFPLMILVDAEIGKAARTARVKHALSSSGKTTAFGLPNTDEVVDLEIIDYKLSQMKAPKRQVTRTPGSSSTRQPASQVYNLKIYNGYEFHQNFVDFALLGSLTTEYVYVDLETDRQSLNQYHNLVKMTGRKLVGVGIQAKRAIEKIKGRSKKFLSIQEVIENPTKLGSAEYAKLVAQVKKNQFDNSDEKSVTVFKSFSNLKQITKSLDRLNDNTFREMFKRLVPMFVNIERSYFPEAVTQFVVKSETHIANDLKIAKNLGDLLRAKVPYVEVMESYGFSEVHGNALIDTLNVLIALEEK